MKASLSDDGTTFTLGNPVGDSWSNTYPIDELDHWLSFYQRQQAEFPKANGAYDETVVELERLKARTG